MLPAIFNRRSVRKYTDTPIPQNVIEEVLQAGILAPSSKNRQPWKFIVVSENAKNEMLATMCQGLERERIKPLLPKSSQHLGGAEHTLKIMQQAPVTIFIINTLGLNLAQPITAEERIFELCNAQSIGAAIQNMLITATELGLGSLWICDTYFAHNELSDWLKTDGELFAAITLGYADESPTPRPRNELVDILEWRM